jgi:7-carboxy-7-deazaguanine synthase
MQGEGPRVGCPTTFLRFGGCNLRCPSWPCDTQFAIDPAYRNEWERVTPSELVERIPTYPNNVCLTGGEPMLQKEEELIELVNLLHKRGHTVEMFTNGTILYPQRIYETVFIVMDWKLPGSGEGDNAFGINNKNRVDNFYQLGPGDVVKFTIADTDDFAAAHKVWEEHFTDTGEKPIEVYPDVYAGIVWDKGVTNAELVDMILANELPWKLSIQVHNHIWDRSQRGI